MTSKEALEELRSQVGNITYFTHDSEGVLQMATFQVRDSGLFEIIEKDLEVLKILKNKKVDIILLTMCPYVSAYNCYYKNATELHLTRKQFNKVKEWLEND